LTIEKKRNYQYYCIDTEYNSIFDCISTIEELESKKQDNLETEMLDYFVYQTKSKNSNTNSYRLALKTNNFKCIDKKRYVFYENLLKLEDNIKDEVNKKEEKSLRELKIRVPREKIKFMLTKINKYSERFGVNYSIKFTYTNSEINLTVFNNEDIDLRNAYNFINQVHSTVLKLEGNIFGIYN